MKLIIVIILFIAINKGCTDNAATSIDFYHRYVFSNTFYTFEQILNGAGSVVSTTLDQVKVCMKTAVEKIVVIFKTTNHTKLRITDTSPSENSSRRKVPPTGAINAEAVSELFRSIQEINANSNSRVSQVRTLKQDSATPTPLEFIKKAGYSGENYYVETPSGYILNLNRVLRRKIGKNIKRVAYLQHGLADSTLSWLHDSDSALAYVLADAGYDVWMGNARGNTYSRNHTTLDPDRDSDFWDFSWHEMGVEDLPTIIDYILNKTGTDGVYYVGHSQGTTVFYVMASTKPEMNSKIKVHVSMSPVGYVSHMKSPFMRTLAKYIRPYELFVKLFNINENLNDGGLLSSLAESICKDEPGPMFCTLVLNVFMGFSPDQMNISSVQAIVDYLPAGMATKQFVHYVQLVSSGRFCQFDNGYIGNLKRYGSISPPEYDLEKISAPVHLFHSTNDWISSDEDVDVLYGELGNCIGRTLFDKPSFNHMDFMYGKYAPDKIYKKIVEIFSRY